MSEVLERLNDTSIFPDINNPKIVLSKRDIWMGCYDPVYVAKGSEFRVVLIEHTETKDYITVRFLGKERRYESNDFWDKFEKCTK